MYKQMRMSKFNVKAYDKNGDMIIYNFLTGISSLIKIPRYCIERFTKLFLSNDVIEDSSCVECTELVEKMLKSGILVYSDIDENVLLEATRYSQIFDSKLILTILPTGRCNFRCPYCFETPQSFLRKDMTYNAQNALLKFVQRAIPNHNALHVSWFGGEPLVAPDVIKRLSEKLIRICDTRHLMYSADMVTNGYYLCTEMFDLLYGLRVYEYMVTIDGFKEQHDKRRFTHNGMGTYDTIMENLLRIRDDKKYRFAKVMVRINMSHGFLDKIDEFVKFIASSFGDDPRFEVMFVPVVKFSGSTFSDDLIYSNHNEIFSRLNQNEVYVNKLCSEDMKLVSILPQQKCPAALKNAYVITPDLKIYKCNAHYDFKANNIGMINENGELLLDENLHNRWYMTNKFVHRSPSSDNDCYNCFYSPCCYKEDSGCPISYLKATPELTLCPLNDENQKKNIIESVLYASQVKPCYIAKL